MVSGETVAAAELGASDTGTADADEGATAADADDVVGWLPLHPMIRIMTAPSAIGPNVCFTVNSLLQPDRMHRPGCQMCCQVPDVGSPSAYDVVAQIAQIRRTSGGLTTVKSLVTALWSSMRTPSAVQPIWPLGFDASRA